MLIIDTLARQVMFLLMLSWKQLQHKQHLYTTEMPVKCRVDEETIWVLFEKNYVFWQYKLMHHSLENSISYGHGEAVMRRQPAVVSLFFLTVPASVPKMSLPVAVLEPGLGDMYSISIK